MDHSQWQQGTRWLHGLTEAEITSIEKQWQVTFPPDYRLFLRKLHAPDRPLAGVFTDADDILKIFSSPSFYNSQTDEIAIHDRYEDLVERLVWSATEGYLPGTGERNVVLEEKKRAERTRFQELVQAAPKVIPVYSHWYLLVEPCQQGNPVFSIVGSDMIVYGASFRDYLIREFLEIFEKELTDRLHEIGEFEGTFDEAVSEWYEHYGITASKQKITVIFPSGESISPTTFVRNRTTRDRKRSLFVRPFTEKERALIATGLRSSGIVNLATIGEIIAPDFV